MSLRLSPTLPAALLLSVALFAATCIGLLSPAKGDAAPFPPSLNLAYSIAVDVWGGEPEACATLDKQVVPEGSLSTGNGWAPSAKSTPVPADAEPSSSDCQLWIDRAYVELITFDMTCAIMLHHVGLLSGVPLSSDPYDVMHPQIPIPELCVSKGNQARRVVALRWRLAESSSVKQRAKIRRQLRQASVCFWAQP